MTKNKITIDGSQGEGGGQVVRTAISLSAITGKPLALEFIRAGRKKPGLMRQHLTSIMAAAEICSAEVKGVELGAEDIEFIPGEITGGEYRFEIGTAGSTSLVAQTVLPILAMAGEPSSVTITGGTHNLWAPTFDFLDRSFLPLAREMGMCVSAEIVKYGFYPAGGGEIKIDIKPIKQAARIELVERGGVTATQGEIILANLKHDIGVRELNKLGSRLDIKPAQGEIKHVESPGPGNVVSVFLAYENVTSVFSNLGQHGTRAEAVASMVCEQARDYLKSDAVVCGHLADQLLLPMALMRGGCFTTTDLSEHTRTNVDIIRKFLDVKIKFTQQGRKNWLVEVEV